MLDLARPDVRLPLSLSAEPVAERLGLIPPGMAYRIPGTSGLSPEVFRALADAVPGAFARTGRFGFLPIRGDAMFKAQAQTGRFPEEVYVPATSRYALLRAVRSVGTPALRVDPGDLVRPRGFDLAPFQEVAVRRLLAERRLVLYGKIGSGKTVVALTAAETLLARGLIDRVVVTVPRALIEDPWLAEWGARFGRRPTVVRGSPAARARIYASPRDPQRFVMKYDTFRSERDQPLAKLFGPRTLWVIDEVHHLKNPRTARFRAARKAADESETDYRLFLTGSLVADRTLDVYGPMALLSLRAFSTYEEFEQRYYRFERYETPRGPGMRPTTILPERLEEFQSVLRTVAYIPDPTAIDLQLPEMRRKEVRVTLTPAEGRAYETLVTVPLFRTLHRGGEALTVEAERNLLSILSLERLFSVDPGALLLSESERASEAIREFGREEWERLVPGTKMRALVTHLAEALDEDSETKVLVFSSFERAHEVLRSAVEGERAERLDAEEREAFDAVLKATVFFSGDLSPTQAEEARARFRTDPTARIFFSTDAGGEGFNLQGVSSTVVHYDDPLSLWFRDQREGRVYRRGQTRSVLFVRYAVGASEELYARLADELPGGAMVDDRVRELLAVKDAERRRLLGEG